MTVPFLDLKSQYESIKNEIDNAIQDVVKSCAFAGGPFVEKFEQEWAAYCHCKHAVGVSNGTDALWTALLASGVGPGDEVVTVPNTFIATAEAISFCGAHPVFVDIDERTFNMDPAKLKAFFEQDCTYDPNTRTLTNKASNRPVKAVIPVHLYGQMADMTPIMEAAGEYHLTVIEDASQSHGATDRGRIAGSVGHAGCFSFYPGKNLGAYGEAGAVVTNDDALAQKIRIFRDHGQRTKYYHQMIGWNSRMDGIQGAVLSVKLRHIDAWNERRQSAAYEYRNRLQQVKGLLLPTERPSAGHVYHIYALRTDHRDGLIDFLKAQDIHCGIHYPVPIHLQEAYAHMNLQEGSFPVAEKCAKDVVSLPMFPELTTAQITTVCTAIEDFIHAGMNSQEVGLRKVS
ncbi:DegT/DnrJ/EryC1/StrS family aminotransferase [Desulfococcus sp.]|uniref:DegT/DnrJ/EryC1/StrS family aminotransferase n=1 Tax=Desulfococcus sp. TaxID=2025834 RepID=UPI0035942E30